MQKKLLTLLLAFVFATTAAFSVTPRSVAVASLGKGVKADTHRLARAMQKRPMKTKANLSIGQGTPMMSRVCQSSDGQEWTIELQNNSIAWSDIYSDMSFEDFPYYLVTARVGIKEGNGYRYAYQYPLYWPSRLALYGPDDEKADNSLVSPEELAANGGGAANVFTMLPIEEMEFYNGGAGYVFPFPSQLGFNHIVEYNMTYDDIFDISDPERRNVITVANGESGLRLEADVHLQERIAQDFGCAADYHIVCDGDNVVDVTDPSNFQQIYVVGAPQGWNIYNSNIALDRVSQEARIYEGTFDVPAFEFSFRFYGYIGDWESWSIGAGEYDEEMEFLFDENGVYEGPCFEGGENSGYGKGSWSCQDWDGMDGIRVKARVDLDNHTVRFEKVPYPANIIVSVNGQQSALLEKAVPDVYSGMLENLPEGEVKISFVGDNGYEIGAEYMVVVDKVPSRGVAFPLSRTEGYPFQINNNDASRLTINVNLAEHIVEVGNPDKPFDINKINITFDENIPSEVNAEEEFEVILRWNREDLEDEGVMFGWEGVSASGRQTGYNENENEVEAKYMVTPSSAGTLVLKACTPSSEAYGKYFTKEITVKKPAYLENLPETLTLIVNTLGESAEHYTYELTKNENGLYTGKFPLESQALISVNYDKEDESKSFIPSGVSIWQYDLSTGDYLLATENYNVGGADTMITGFTRYVDGDFVYWMMTGNGELTFTLNPETMSVTVSDPDFKPEVGVEMSEMHVGPADSFEIMVNSNFDHFDNWGDDMENISVSDENVVSLERVSNRGNEGFVIYMRTQYNESDEPVIVTINTKAMQRFGLEPVVVKVYVDKPQVSVENTEMYVRSYHDFEIAVKSNFDHFVDWGDDRENISISDENIVSLGWTDNRGKEGFSIYLNANGVSEEPVTVTINTKAMQRMGIEPVVVTVYVKNIAPEGFNISTDRIEMREGEWTSFTAETYPMSYDVWIQMDDTKMKCTNEWNKFYLLAVEPGETSVDVVAGYWDEETGGNPMVEIPVTILPKDAVVAEHVVFHRMLVDTQTTLALNDHADGSAPESVAWTSSDPSVAEVSATGEVLAKSEGKAVITADCGRHTVMTGIHVQKSTDVEEVASRRLSVYTVGTTVMVNGLEAGEQADVFTADGALLMSRRAVDSTLRLEIANKGAYIVKAAGESYKVVL